MRIVLFSWTVLQLDQFRAYTTALQSELQRTLYCIFYAQLLFTFLVLLNWPVEDALLTLCAHFISLFSIRGFNKTIYLIVAVVLHSFAYLLTALLRAKGFFDQALKHDVDFWLGHNKCCNTNKNNCNKQLFLFQLSIKTKNKLWKISKEWFYLTKNKA